MFSLSLPSNKLLRQIFVLWFILSISALAFSGIYSFLPYALRTPALAQFLNMQNLFSLSLMVHVNLGVLVWFLSSSAMLMTIITKENFAPFSFTASISSIIGTIFIILSPFIGESEPVKNDYIPILHNFVFIIGIALFLSGILLQVILTILSFNNINHHSINLITYINALIFIVATICFIKSYLELSTLSRSMDLLEYYQLLFWGSGHILQFNYIQLIIFAWIILLFELNNNLIFPKKAFFYLQSINFMLIISATIIYWIYPIDSYELYNFFTLHMKHLGGILVTITALFVIYFIPKNFSKLEFTTFYASAFLICSGGIIGYLIDGANVTIPAHYHGVILGITVGLMGLFYTLLPKLGFKKVKDRLAIWQILLYTVGQFIHIIALAISGGYGVLRKSPGETLSTKAKIFMGAMGVGGSIALIGGVLFIILILKNMKKETYEH